MKQKILIIAILSSALVISLGIISSDNIFAQNPFEDKFQYPIEELGNCTNRDACKKYCDSPDNFDACIAFAEKNNIMPQEEIEMAKKFMAGGGKGPGGCRGKEECETYCDNIDNINECVAFAEQNDILPPRELEEAKKVKAAIEKGIKPPACKNKRSCDAYCASPDHMEECLVFAEAAGFIPPEELDDAKKVLEAIKKGVKPPACRGKKECDIYCSEESHFEECINFAEAAGFMKPEEMEMMRKTGGKGPGGCRGKDECESFCQNEENMETCANFALEHGLMKPEEMEMMRKTGGKGPGGCRGREECESFCDNPDNQETCFNFAQEHNLIPPEEMEKMKEGMGKMRESLQMAPPEISDCLKSTVGEEVLNKLQSGNFAPPRELGEQMRSCFEKMGPPRHDFSPEGEEFQDGRMLPPSNMMPPNGQTREDMMPPQGFVPPVGGQVPPNYHPEGIMPPEGYLKPPEEFIPQGNETYPYQQYEQQYQQQYQQQYEQQLQQQFQQEYQQQYQQQYEQMMPPPSSMRQIPPLAQIFNFFIYLLTRYEN